MSIDKKTIQSYTQYAEKWAQRMRTGSNFAHDYLEKPAMYSLLPDLKKKTVLCIGCGTGEECAHLKSLGAAKVIGIDLSKGMIKEAKTGFPDLEFHVMDVEHLRFSAKQFDFAYSSLCMHYLKDWTKALTKIHQVLKPKGTYLFSTHYPPYFGALDVSVKNNLTTDVKGNYYQARKIKDQWFGEFQVNYYHKTLESIFREIRESGFVMLDYLEPKPIPAGKKIAPEFWEKCSRFPLFMILKLGKNTIR